MSNLLKASRKENNRKSGAAAAHKQTKRLEAEARQASYAALTFDEKLQRATPGSKVYNKLMLQASKKQTKK